MLPERLVLPSPTGATVASRLADSGAVCVAACLRNASAVAAWIARQRRGEGVVAVIPAGEAWADGGLRPAVEDLWGAGAVIAGLVSGGVDGLSPEAEAAWHAYEGVRGRELEALLACGSGKELLDAGYRADVEIAAEVDTTTVVPLLADGRFVPAEQPG